MISVGAPLQPLAVHQMHGSKWWLTLLDYTLFLRVNSDKTTRLTIPAGYRFDRSSIPWEGIVTKDSLGCIAPLIHDTLYGCEGVPNGQTRTEKDMTCSPWRIFTRAESDEIFRAVMLADGVKPWRATVAYWAVRLFGRSW